MRHSAMERKGTAPQNSRFLCQTNERNLNHVEKKNP
jgi:hypothetical protein